MAKISSTILNKSGESEYLCFQSWKKNCQFFPPLSMRLAVDFSYMAFIMFRHIPSRAFVFIMNGYMCGFILLFISPFVDFCQKFGKYTSLAMSEVEGTQMIILSISKIG